MLSSFKKIISKTPDLNEVQQNVFDTVQSLQSTNLFTRFDFNNANSISNNVLTSLGVFKLDPGEYSIFVQATVFVPSSSFPTSIRASLNIQKVNTSVDLFEDVEIGVNQAVGRSFYQRMELLTSNGDSFQLNGRINAAGGTVTSRNLQNISITAFRRFL